MCFLLIHSGHQVRWTYQPGSHRRKVTLDFHPPSFCGACLNFSREQDSAIPFPRRPCSKRERFFGGTKKTTSQVDIFNIIQKRPTTVFTLKLSRRSNGGSYKEVRSRLAKSLPYCLVRTTGHTGGRSHRISHPLSFCGVCLNFSREKDSAIRFRRRP